MKASLEDLQRRSISPLGKQYIADVLKAASNPHSERVDVVIKTLPKDRQKIINDTAKAVKGISDDVLTRGRERLLAMTEDEWQQILKDTEGNVEAD